MEPSQAIHAPEHVRTQPFDIMIVEDEPAIAEFMGDILSEEGFRVKLVGDGVTSLQILEDVQPRLIFLDLLIPARSGLEVMAEYQHRPGHHAPIIAMTANRVDQAKVLQAGATALLLKPFELDRLFELVDRYIEKD